MNDEIHLALGRWAANDQIGQGNAAFPSTFYPGESARRKASPWVNRGSKTERSIAEGARLRNS